MALVFVLKNQRNKTTILLPHLYELRKNIEAKIQRRFSTRSKHVLQQLVNSLKKKKISAKKQGSIFAFFSTSRLSRAAIRGEVLFSTDT
jgi:hypothetical protein